MRVKEEMALVKVGGETFEKTSESAENVEFSCENDDGAKGKGNSACSGAASGSAGTAEVWPVGEQKKSESWGEKIDQGGANAENVAFYSEETMKKEGRESPSNAKGENREMRGGCLWKRK